MKPAMTARNGLHPMPSARRMGAWLQVDGSLSARIASVSGRLTVQVLRQGPVRLQPAEAERLGCPAGSAAHGREVVLLADGVPVVYARSVLQAVHARGTWKAIRGLGSRALADLLFGQPAAQRSGFEFARFAPGSLVAATVHRRWREATGADWGRREVWARCSLFTRRGARLLLTECFAPAIQRFDAPQRARAVPWRGSGHAASRSPSPSPSPSPPMPMPMPMPSPSPSEPSAGADADRLARERALD